MKVILNGNQDTIDLRSVNVQHIIVGYHHQCEDWCLLTRENYDEGFFSFRPLNDEFTNGNGYSYVNTEDVREIIKSFKGDVYAFNTMKEVFEFLLPKLN